MSLAKGESAGFKLLVLMGLPILFGLQAVGGAADPATPVPGTADVAGREKAAKLERVLARLEATMRQLNRESCNTDAVIETVGRDPVKLCSWVREQTAFAAYAGVLRGPRGVLIDRVGSDIDRALLLGELVNLSGYETRLARAELNENEAEQRLAAGGSKLPRISTFAPAAEMVKLLDRGANQTLELAAMVKRENDAQVWDKEQLQAARDHWWIQYMDGRSWVDLDPAVLEKGSPSHLGTGKVTNFACTLPDLSVRIPPDLFHSVELKVAIERWQEGKLIEEPVFSWAIKTWDDPGIHVYLMHGFQSAPDFAAAGSDGVKLKAAVLSEKVWQPVMMVNGRYRGPKTFDETGVLGEAPVGGAAAVGNTVRGKFGELAGIDGSTKRKPDSVLTAEWLDITLKTPGYPVQTVRREVFDSIGPATRASAAKTPLAKPSFDDTARLRRALALSATADNLVASCRYSGDYVLQQRAKRLLNARKELLLAVAKPAAPGSREILARCSDPDFLGMMNFGRGLEKGDISSYVDRPNVCRLIWQNEITAEGKVQSVAMSDFPLNSVANMAKSSNERFAAAIRRGVADTLCERIAVGKMAREANDKGIQSTADAFDRAGALPWVTVRDSADAALSTIPLPSDVRQRVLDDLAAGNLVVIPKTSIEGRWAWWRVDPKSGRTIGVMDNGRCADATESAVTHIPEAGLERTLATRSLFPRAPMKEVGRLAQEIIEFRQPATMEAMMDCWIEAFDIINPGVAVF